MRIREGYTLEVLRFALRYLRHISWADQLDTHIPSTVAIFLNRTSVTPSFWASCFASQSSESLRMASSEALGPRKYSFTSRVIALSYSSLCEYQLSEAGSSDARNVAQTRKSTTLNGPCKASLSQGLWRTATKVALLYSL